MTQYTITLPDGAQREYPAGSSAADVAADLSKSLSKAAFAASWDGELVDLNRPFERDVKLAIYTNKDEEQALELIRHDFAHVMARAVQELWPETKVTIGPVVANGWYYDFDRDEAFTPEDLEKIEKRMRAIIETRDEVRREVWTRDQAIEHFRANDEPFKVELVEAIPEDQNLTMYWHGYWMDLCRGPHLVHTAQLPADAFKLMSVAGAYWRGDSNNKQLQRIYGVGFRNKNELRDYLHRLEEAEKRDHRKLGREMDLFHMQDIAPGQVFWHPNGWTVYTQLQDYMRRRQRAGGYVELNTPQVVSRSLWEASGHWEKYQENMFIVEVDEDHAREKSINALKPMNCPCHVQVFNQGLKSYRDLPLRMAEFGSCARYEPSGALHGIMRVRGFNQDDGHIFCTEDQIGEETQRFIDFLAQTYRDLGFDNFKVKFSDRPEQRAGSDEVWDKAETALREATEAAQCGFELNPGEGAFYGPKLEFVLTDAIGRDWQCGTLQVDFVMPERLDASYIGADNERHRPVMLHRATLGSFERFIGILIEEHAGRFPLWLAPTQVAVASITGASEECARRYVDQLNAAGMRAVLDVRNEKINYKVREHSLAKVPYILAVGERESENHSCTVRTLGSKQTEVLDFAAFLEKAKLESTPPDQRPDYEPIKMGSGHANMEPAE